MIKPVQWMTRQAAIGLKDLPGNSVWLLSKALTAPATIAAATGDGVRWMAAAVDSLQEGSDTADVRIRRAEVAIARAKQAELDALSAAQHVKLLSDAAMAADKEGKQRIRQAAEEAKHDVDRRTKSAREHFAQLLNEELEKANVEATESLERVKADVRRSVEKARGVARAAADMARDQINSAQWQSASAQSLAAEATAAAELIASEARAQAEVIAEYAEERAKAADAAVEKARRTQLAMSDGVEVRVEQIEQVSVDLAEGNVGAVVE